MEEGNGEYVGELAVDEFEEFSDGVQTPIEIVNEEQARADREIDRRPARKRRRREDGRARKGPRDAFARSLALDSGDEFREFERGDFPRREYEQAGRQGEESGRRERVGERLNDADGDEREQNDLEEFAQIEEAFRIARVAFCEPDVGAFGGSRGAEFLSGRERERAVDRGEREREVSGVFVEPVARQILPDIASVVVAAYFPEGREAQERGNACADKIGHAGVARPFEYERAQIDQIDEEEDGEKSDDGHERIDLLRGRGRRRGFNRHEGKGAGPRRDGNARAFEPVRERDRGAEEGVEIDRERAGPGVL